MVCANFLYAHTINCNLFLKYNIMLIKKITKNQMIGGERTIFSFRSFESKSVELMLNMQVNENNNQCKISVR